MKKVLRIVQAAFLLLVILTCIGMLYVMADAVNTVNEDDRPLMEQLGYD